MRNILESIFIFGGYTAVFCGLTISAIHLIEKLFNAGDRKRSVETQIIALLEAIKHNTRPKP